MRVIYYKKEKVGKVIMLNNNEPIVCTFFRCQSAIIHINYTVLGEDGVGKIYPSITYLTNAYLA